MRVAAVQMKFAATIEGNLAKIAVTAGEWMTHEQQDRLAAVLDHLGL